MNMEGGSTFKVPLEYYMGVAASISIKKNIKNWENVNIN